MSLDARGPGAQPPQPPGDAPPPPPSGDAAPPQPSGDAAPPQPSDDAPPSTALRRALARARDGKPLDRGEAATLLHARGADLDRLLEYAGRTRDGGLTAAGRPGVI